MAQVIILTNIFLFGCVAWAYLRFGSITAALAYVRGDRLIADRYTPSFGRLEPGQSRDLVLHVTNLAARPITILGARTSCTCAAADGLPVTIQPGVKQPLKIRVWGKPKSGAVVEKLHFYTDDPAQPELIIQVVGKVINAEHSSENVAARRPRK
ncbi:MAG: DUF1573 domain-containing protein [Isosphaeraceae bacterium]|nr:DUF1573 domain-containing protein [Isosphaeraceae bacterium]